VRRAYARGKAHALIVVAEGARLNAAALGRYFAQQPAALGYELRVTTLGHVQRGGAPGALDRLLATRLGDAATRRLAAGERGVLVAQREGQLGATPLCEVAGRTKPLDLRLFELAHVLAM
jgi:6-phosphofructokinase 1